MPRERTLENAPCARAGRGATAIALALSTLAATSSCNDEPEPTATNTQELTTVETAWKVGTTAIGAVEKFYKARNWFNCSVVGNCGQTEAHIEATNIINTLGGLLEQSERQDLMAAALTLLDDAKRDYGQPELLSADEEARLLSQATGVFRSFYQKLIDTTATDANQVDSAYRLARMFNVVAALVDNIGQLALARGLAPMNTSWILDKRAQTLQVNLALVGAQNVWYQCPGNAAPSEISIVESFSNSLATKKLWKKFADYKFAFTSFGNDCSVFRHVTGQHICAHDCSHDFPLGFCSAGVLPADDVVYKRELPKILEKMNRDPVVSDVRRSIETLVGLAADRGGGLLWQTGTLVDAWRVTSSTGYDQIRVGGAASGWQAILTGDFDGDGDGDVLLRNANQLRLWLLGDKRLETETAATTNAPNTDIVFSGDVDGDKVSDLVWSELSDPRQNSYVTRTWLMTAGSTTPRSITSTPAPETQRVFGVGHFDADSQHRADVLFRSTATNAVSVSLNGGSRIQLGVPGAEWAIKGVGDFNADGFADVLFYNSTTGTVAVWATQNGNILADVSVDTVPPEWGWSIVGVTDLDHDGYSDIVWRHTSGAISNWMMNGASSTRERTPGESMSSDTRFVGTIEFGPPTPANTPVSVLAESVCGVNGTLRNPGFADYEQWWNNTFDGGSGTFLGDVDGDSKADLVSVGGDYVGVIRSTGTAFGDYETWRSESVAGTFATLMGDVTGDGQADLITRGTNYVKVWPSRNLSFDAGTFWYRFTFNGNRGNLVGDVDGDRKADVVALSDNDVKVLRSTGSSFNGSGSLFRSTAAYGSRATLLGDVTGDGKADLVAVNDNNIKIFPSTGTSFGNPTTVVATFWGSKATLLGDVDGDGLSDLVALEDNHVRVLRAKGGSFDVAGAPSYETWWGRAFYGNHANLIGDVDGNKRLDIAATADGYIGVIRSQ